MMLPQRPSVVSMHPAFNKTSVLSSMKNLPLTLFTFVLTMSNLAAYCPPVNSGAAAPPPDAAASSNKRPPRSSSFNDNNFNNDDDDNNEDGEEEEEEQQTELKRRCIDYHSPAVLDLTSRLYRKSNRRSHALPGGSGLAYPYLQCHTNYVSVILCMCLVLTILTFI